MEPEVVQRVRRQVHLLRANLRANDQGLNRWIKDDMTVDILACINKTIFSFRSEISLKPDRHILISTQL